jgi:hypothetical protein
VLVLVLVVDGGWWFVVVEFGMERHLQTFNKVMCLVANTTKWPVHGHRV